MAWEILSVTALIVALAALGLAAMSVRRLGERDPASVPRLVRHSLRIPEAPRESSLAFSEDRRDRQRVAFVVNAAKPGTVVLREAAFRACSLRYLPEPLWLTTTPDDSGRAAAHQAVRSGAGVLVAVGGDGTVRAVASIAAEYGVPMGIIPHGTGNLLARNLGLPVRDSYAALRVALDGAEVGVDVALLTVTREGGAVEEHPFLVIAGLGLDAEMVAGARDSLKRRIGWGAYFLAALRHFGGPRMNAEVTVDDRPPVSAKMRTALIANCGRLPGGVVLVPEASYDDGTLDIATIDAKGGIAGWAGLVGEVVLQGTKRGAPNLPSAWRIGRIDHASGTRATITADSPQRIQVDGEPLGRALSITGTVDAGALRVRVGGTTERRRRGDANGSPSNPS
jgi:diacylglycerol kinase (ATP)